MFLGFVFSSFSVINSENKKEDENGKIKYVKNTGSFSGLWLKGEKARFNSQGSLSTTYLKFKQKLARPEGN